MKPFTVTVGKPKNLQKTLARAKQEASSRNIKHELYESHGHASGYKFEGNYMVHPSSVVITVTKKPALIPMSVVEKEIVKFCARYLRDE